MEIGQKVRVKGIKQRIPGNIVNRLKQNPIGTIKEFVRLVPIRSL